MKTELTPMTRFWRLLKPDKKEIRNVYAYAIFSGLIGLSLPLGIQAIVNLIQGGQISTSWIVLVTFVVIGVAATGILQIFQLRITENLQQKIFARAAIEFSYRIPRIKLEALYKHHAPELMNRFFDIVSVQKGLSKVLIDFSAALLQVVFGLILLSLYHPFFILFSMALLILVYAIFRFTAKKGLDTSLKESYHKYKVVHWLEELARTSQTFKLSGGTQLPLEKSDVEVSSYLEARESHFRILVQQYSLMVIFKVIVATGLLAIGGVLVMEQLMNIGQFIAAEIIILMVMSSVEKLILSLETIYDVLTSLEKVGQVTDLELEANEGEDLETHCKEDGLDVELKNVYFSYPNKKEQILKGVDIQIKRSEKVVLTGENSSGKSTLLRTISGMYDINEGSITYDNLTKGNINLNSLRSVIGNSLHQEVLFEGSLYENISIGRKNVDLQSVQWALENVGLSDFANSLPKGLNSAIEPMGKNLPRNVVQKLLLARSIAGHPKLLLLEDSLESLDEKDRNHIADFLFHPARKWTLIMISTKNDIIQKADRLIELKDGKAFEINHKINL